MKLSRYNYVKRCSKNKYLVWNTFGGAFATLNEKEFKELNDLKGKSYEENENQYIDNGFVVDNDLDELKAIINKRNEAFNDEKGCSFRILTTTTCNARCSYCYEQINDKIILNKETADDILSYIFNEVKDKECFSITWFGGEPLINHKMISYMNEKIYAFIKDKKIKYTNRMITNASLFTKKLVETAKKEWKLDSVQVTLDGTKDKHNKIKNYINIEDAFSLTIKHINYLIEANIPLTIRLNYSLENYQDMQKLIKYLSGSLKEKVRIYPSPVFSINGNDSSHVISLENLGKYHYLINKSLKKHGFKEHVLDFPLPKANPCGSVLPSYKVIMPDGRFYKCATEITYKNHCVGDIYKGEVMNDLNKSWTNVDLEEECKECVFLPICQGGCRANLLCSSDMMKCCVTKYVQDYMVEKIGKKEL